MVKIKIFANLSKTKFFNYNVRQLSETQYKQKVVKNIHNPLSKEKIVDFL